MQQSGPEKDHIKKRIGAVITVVTGLFMLLYFYGAPIKAPCETFFATGGDGLKDYYTTSYYIQHDTSYSHSAVMNYPHGEHIMFTGSQPSHSVVLKFINDHIAGLGEYTVGIINMAMLLSLLAGMVFIYLLFVHFRLNYLYSAIASVGIALLSPQLARMGGHFSLSYVFVIPAVLYLLAIFHQKPGVWKSVIMGLFMLWAIGVHVYMLGFYSFLVLLYWIYLFFSRPSVISLQKKLLHFSLQFALPLFLFLLFSALTDSVTDRTTQPWGFLYYKAYPESVLLPIDMPYGAFIRNIKDFGYIDWEGRAFVGLVAATCFLIMFVLFFVRLFNRQYINALKPANDNVILNVFFWISVIALLYSFGVPFVFGLERLVDFIGPLRQMRGIARFSWIFFYVLNIYVFWKIWCLKDYLRKPYWNALVVAALAVLYMDAFYNAGFWSATVNNRLPAIADRENRLPENQWVHSIDTDKFQAVLPVPYYHVGSENIWIEPRGGIDMYASVVSWKTGLPSMGVMLSRTSLSQTLINCELVWEAYRKPAILEMLEKDKDILIVALNESQIPSPQKQLLEISTRLFDAGYYSLYRLDPDSLLIYYESLYEQVRSAFEEKELYGHNGYYTTSPEKDFMATDFPDYGQDLYYFVPGSRSLGFGSWECLIDEQVPGSEAEGEYVLSFWIEGVHTDLFLRTQMIIELSDNYGNIYDHTLTDLFRNIVAVDGNWVLIEKTISVKSPGDRVKCLLRNRLLKNMNYTYDQVMFRAAETDVYREGNGWLMRNNRFYVMGEHGGGDGGGILTPQTAGSDHID